MLHGSFKKLLRESINESQKCQRNWDLNQQIDEEDKELILESVTNCPSKQNINYYNLHVIEDRKMIEKIHENTKGFGPIYGDYDSEKMNGYYREERGEEGEYHTNPQVLAQMLLVFTKNEENLPKREKNDEYEEDRLMAVGIAAGYCNIISTQLGYATGCCKCFDFDGVKNIIGEKPMLLMGVGIPDKKRNRREHQTEDFKFPTLRKMKNISVKHYV